MHTLYIAVIWGRLYNTDVLLCMSEEMSVSRTTHCMYTSVIIQDHIYALHGPMPVASGWGHLDIVRHLMPESRNWKFRSHSDRSAVFIRQWMGFTPWWHGASLRRRVQPVYIAINVYMRESGKFNCFNNCTVGCAAMSWSGGSRRNNM